MKHRSLPSKTALTAPALAFAASLLAGCTPSGQVNPALIQDGQLVVTTLQAIDAGIPGFDAGIVDVGLKAIQLGLSDLQSGAVTANTFATTVTGQVNAIVPPLLAATNANATIRTGASLLEGLLPVLLADAAPPSTSAPAKPVTAAMGPDPRGKLQAWVNSAKGP